MTEFMRLSTLCPPTELLHFRQVLNKFRFILILFRLYFAKVIAPEEAPESSAQAGTGGARRGVARAVRPNFFLTGVRNGTKARSEYIALGDDGSYL